MGYIYWIDTFLYLASMLNIFFNKRNRKSLNLLRFVNAAIILSQLQQANQMQPLMLINEH